MTANSATAQPPFRSGAAASSCMIPSAFAVRRDFFRSLSTATLKFRMFPIFSADRFAILGSESLALRISAFFGGAERMVPIATRKRFMGG
jgi:hypothetical protein